MVNYLETGSTDPCLNLATEEHILKERRTGDWLMLWQNANTVVVGLNQNTREEIDSAFVESHGITVVRRMTGGGAVYHDLGNLNYSFITDAGKPEEMTIGRFTQPVCRALAQLGVDAKTSGRNDILVDGKKVSGVAQRLYKGRILHHGTLLFNADLSMVAGALNADAEKFTSKSSKSVSSRVGNLSQWLPEGLTIRDFWAALLRELTADGMIRARLTEKEQAAIAALADEKYRSWEWTYGRSPEYSYKNRRRFAGGTLELRLNIRDGVICGVQFLGDYMASESNAPAAGALTGVRFEREAVGTALKSAFTAQMFGTITIDEILELFFS